MHTERNQRDHYRGAGGGIAAAPPALRARGPRSDYGRQLVVVGAVIALGLLIAGAFLIVSEIRGESLAILTKDPVSAGRLDFETGIMTRVEVMIWIGAAAAAVTAGILAQRLERPEAMVLVWFGLLGIVMAVDDSLMIHEAVSSIAGVPLIELSYIGVIAVLIWRFRETIMSRTPWLVLAGALCGLGMSEAVDLLDDHLNLGAGAGVEDTFKFIGILLFAAYLVLMAQRTVAAAAPSRSA